MKKLKYWIPTVVWMGVIFYLSSRTPSQLKGLFPFIHNFNPGHIIAYFVLGFFSYYSLLKTFPESMHFPWVMLISLIYGISDEFHQHFVPGRMPDINDLVNDLIGTIVALMLIRLWQKQNEKKRKAEASSQDL